MAMNVDITKISSLISTHLEERVRYRCLVIQSSDLVVLSRICDQVAVSARILGDDVMVLDALNQFDEIGAFSCDAILGNIDKIAAVHPLIIIGPLHFLDYWSEQIQSRFWRHVAAFSIGPGIIITDTMRTETLRGPFRVLEDYAQGGLRCLNSRLASTQDRLA